MAVASISMAWSSIAGAQGAGADPAYLPEPYGPLPAERQEVVVDDGVTEGLMVGGALVLGSSYAAAAISGTRSDLRADTWLAAPIIGPWVALARRDGCNFGPRRDRCAEASFDALGLVAVGGFQALGTLMMLGAVVSARGDEDQATVQVAPAVGQGRYGVTALGRF